ncbi:unnamed protein product [Didymodactylos carnosus]|uniref:Uncharacterized protein n=1 Tax=Didymodactylos carnosus TaxID=1234261 RepID=A0A8S2FMF1_9BILA|nr:unnamed protein product [Didymodactylos carnosus]CAF4300844.1 unnamed protein product [Didymodactylos carnosus]
MKWLLGSGKCLPIQQFATFNRQTQTLLVNCPFKTLEVILSQNYYADRKRGSTCMKNANDRYLNQQASKISYRQKKLNQEIVKARQQSNLNQISLLIKYDEYFTVKCGLNEQLFVQPIVNDKIINRLRNKTYLTSNLKFYELDIKNDKCSISLKDLHRQKRAIESSIDHQQEILNRTNG